MCENSIDQRVKTGCVSRHVCSQRHTEVNKTEWLSSPEFSLGDTEFFAIGFQLAHGGKGTRNES